MKSVKFSSRHALAGRLQNGRAGAHSSVNVEKETVTFQIYSGLIVHGRRKSDVKEKRISAMRWSMLASVEVIKLHPTEALSDLN